MKGHFEVLIAALATAILAGSLGNRLAMAQSERTAPSQAAQSVETQAPYALQYEGRVTVRTDRTATDVFTERLKILTPSAIATVSQQELTFVEGMQTLETVEAFTEKSDGTKVPVGPANMITRDAASGAQATYMRDRKQRTVIFQDVQVGDTLVMTHRKETRQSLFPGHFFYADVFERSRPFASAHVIVEAPDDLDLRVSTIGPGLSDRVEEADGVRRHTVTLSPQPYLPEEVRAVSPIDRDPVLSVSTFNSYEEMGLAYGAAAFPKAVVTPEIAALADDITKGVADRRQQAAAIDAWMKKNIRYVAVYLSLGRVVPNDAASVLSNKFGDCKDKSTLMSALLAAKGIASEAGLINFGGAYTLPEPPTMVALNHVILYLPEFDLYDDPTQNFAAFGVLAVETYDKPVVRVGTSGATLAHTPAMKPEDHTNNARTIINVAVDGTVTGQTEESGTGVFGMVLRFAGSNVQTLGHETISQRQLQSFNTPGTGRYDLGNSTETVDPVTMKSQFTLRQRFKAPIPGGRVAIPFGLPQVLRPGNFLLGTRLNGRKSAFICYAGHQSEDIDATFDQSLPMPVALMPITIDNPAFTYRATFVVEGRTLKMHREFVSRVTGQVCAPELEAQIAGDMDSVRVNVNSSYTFGSTQAAQQTLELTRTVASDHSLRLDFLYALNPDCTSLGFATVRVLDQPKHGKITFENGTGFPTFPQDNLRYECNKRRSDGVVLTYEPDSGFTGMDSINIDVIFASGSSRKRHYSIEVK
jgi:transglutaminase-like putative cysteine protease